MNGLTLIVPIVSSLLITVLLMPAYIRFFRQKKLGQVILKDGPEWQEAKNGTPTMGGVVFLIAALITSLWVGFWQHSINASLLILLFILLVYGSVGFLDDYIKIFKKRNMGLTAGQKFLAQVIAAIVFYIVYRFEGMNDALYIPGLGDCHIGWFFHLLFVIIWLSGFSNAVNLTDGLDGLVAGLGTISFGTYAIIAYHQHNMAVLIICLAMIGGLVGFFIFNHKPAKIFMGDVGSLAIGAILAAVSILLHQEWTLLLVGLIYVIETLSVIIQVTVFRATGKRVFKMSPIHHHFEMLGWSEWKVDIVFWCISLVMSALTLWIVL